MLTQAFGIASGVIVDLHMRAWRSGSLTQADEPDQIERDLMQLLP